MRYMLAVMDRSCARFAGAFVVAAIVWTLLLMRIGGWLGDDAKSVTPPPALQMQLVELPPPPSPSPAPSPVESPPHTTAPHPSQPAVRERAVAHRSRTEAPAEPAPSPAPAAAATEAPTAHAPSAAPTQPIAAAATDTPKPTGFAEARLLSQPLPELPDDLREVAYQTVAIARFAVHVDGTCDVELIKPTQNPRLNQILLEALHNWRFFPALDNGHPVESRRDVRVHFNVQ